MKEEKKISKSQRREKVQNSDQRRTWANQKKMNGKIRNYGRILLSKDDQITTGGLSLYVKRCERSDR